MNTGLDWMDKPRNVKNCWHSPGGWRETWDGFSLGAFRRTQGCRHLDYRLLASRSMRN